MKEPPYGASELMLHSPAVPCLCDPLEHVDHLVKGRELSFPPFLLGIFPSVDSSTYSVVTVWIRHCIFCLDVWQWSLSPTYKGVSQDFFFSTIIYPDR